MATIRAVVERPVHDPGPGEVIRVEACGHLPQRHVCQDGQLSQD
jgi:hypothetical protein